MPKRDLPPPAVAIDVPRWPACVAIGLVAALTLLVLPRLGMYLATCKVAIALFLVTRLPGGKEPAPHLLREGDVPTSADAVITPAAISSSRRWRSMTRAGTGRQTSSTTFSRLQYEHRLQPDRYLVLSRVAKVLMMY